MIAQARKRRSKAQVASMTDFVKCFYVLLNTVGGTMTIQKDVLKKLPADWQTRVKIENLGQIGIEAYRISIVKQNQPVIIKPDKDLILPD